MVTALITTWNVRSANFLNCKVWAILRSQPIHLSMQVGRWLGFLVHLSVFHICLSIGLILALMMIRRRYLMIHVALLLVLVICRLLTIILTITPLIHVDFLWELCVELLLARHLTIVIAAESVRSIDLSWWHWCKVHFVVLVIHFNSSD